jgi:hypothetical protein
MSGKSKIFLYHKPHVFASAAQQHLVAYQYFPLRAVDIIRTQQTVLMTYFV